jgi:2-polyprenyl-6-methoxyphenol hydroxylase-like FAD-dependent oxidoreductase
MNNIQDKKIAIVGGGPGGLTLARLLQMNGADVNVYERDEHANARPKGATLDLHDESGLRALREAGLMDEFNANYRPGADLMHLMDMHGNSILEENVRRRTRKCPARDRPRSPATDLAGLVTTRHCCLG